MNDYLLRLLIKMTNEISSLKTKVAKLESDKIQEDKELTKLLQDLANTCDPDTGKAI